MMKTLSTWIVVDWKQWESNVHIYRTAFGVLSKSVAYLSKLLSMFVFAHSGCDIDRCTVAVPAATLRCRLPSSPNKSNEKSLSDGCNEVDAINGFSLPVCSWCCCSLPNVCSCGDCCWRNISKIVRTSFLILISILSRRVDSSFICVVIELWRKFGGYWT